MSKAWVNINTFYKLNTNKNKNLTRGKNKNEEIKIL